MKASLTVAGAALLALAGTSHAATAPVPATGAYNMVVYDKAQTGTGCSGKAGGTSMGTFQYWGAGLGGSMALVAKNDKGDFGFTKLQFPVTPAAGVTSWKGALKVTDQPSGLALSTTFTGTLTYITTGHFMLLLNVKVGNCTLTRQITAYSLAFGLGVNM